MITNTTLLGYIENINKELIYFNVIQTRENFDNFYFSIIIKFFYLNDKDRDPYEMKNGFIVKHDIHIILKSYKLSFSESWYLV